MNDLIPVATNGKHEQANKFQYHYHDHPTLLINHKSESAWLVVQGSIGDNLTIYSGRKNSDVKVKSH